MSVQRIRGRAHSRLTATGLFLAAFLAAAAAPPTVGQEATPAAQPQSPVPSLSGLATESPSPFAEVFGDVAPEAIPFRYECDAGGSFTASDLAYGAAPLDPPLSSFAGWQFVGLDDGVAQFVSPPVERTSSEEAPFESQAFQQEPSGYWSMTSSGDCAPEAIFRHQKAVAGYWELAASDQAPGADATSFDIKVWGSEGCRSKVRVQGNPRVIVTRSAVLLAVAVHPPRGDTCGPVGATRVTVDLPEPLGDRPILDAGRLPMPVVVRAPA